MRARCSRTTRPAKPLNKADTTSVQPRDDAEIAYAETTDDGTVRRPSVHATYSRRRGDRIDKPNVGCCEGFRMPAAHGRCRALRRPAYENLQGKKPRERSRQSCRALDYGDLIAARNLKAK